MADEIKKEEQPSVVYICSKCNQIATIENGVVIRKCDHENDSVIASISSTCTSSSKMG